MQFLIDNAIWITLAASLIGLIFVWLQRKWILAHDTGTDQMRQIAGAIRTGAGGRKSIEKSLGHHKRQEQEDKR